MSPFLLFALLPLALADNRIILSPPGRSAHDFWHNVVFEPVSIPSVVAPEHQRWDVGMESCIAWDNGALLYSGCKNYGSTPYLIGQCSMQSGPDKFFRFKCPQCVNVYTPNDGTSAASQHAWCLY